MTFVKPLSNNPFPSDAFRYLSAGYLDWCASWMLLDQDSDAPRGSDFWEHIHALESVLHKIDDIAKSTGAEEPLLRMAILIADFDELKDIEVSRMQQEKQNLDWENLGALPRFREVLNQMFEEGYLRSFLKNTNLTEPVHSWLNELPAAVRIRFYLDADVTEDTVRLLERLGEELPDPYVFSVLSAGITNMDETSIQIVQSYADREAENQLVDIFLGVWGMFYWYPEQLQKLLNQLEISQLITLLENVFVVRGYSPASIPFPSGVKYDPAIAQTLEAILALATQDPYVVKKIERSIIETCAKKGGKNPEALLNLLFLESPFHLGNEIMPLGDEDPDFDEMVDSLAGFLLSEDVKPALIQWIRRENRNPDTPSIVCQLSRDVLGVMLYETLETANPVIGLLWLWIAGTRWQKNDPDVDEWLGMLIEFAGDDQSLVRRVLTLDNEIWGDSAFLEMWADYVTKEWILGFCEAEEKTSEEVPLFVRNFVQSREFRQRINVFSASSDVLVQTDSAEVSSLSPLMVSILIAAALGDIQSRERIQNNVDAWGFIFLVAIELENPDAESVWERFEYDKRIIDVPYRIWKDLGISEDRILISTLLCFVQRNLPDVMLGVARWQEYVQKTILNQNDQVPIENVLDQLQAESLDESIKFAIEICLVAEIIRSGEGSLPESTEYIQQWAERSLKLLHGLRSKFREPDEDPSVELYAAASAAVVGGTVLGWWKVLKPLLLMFRSLPALSVGSNLSHLDRSKVSLSVIPGAIDFILRMVNTPDDLRDLRRSMTLDLLDKLKPFKGDSKKRMLKTPEHSFEGFDPTRIEPDPAWRTAYLRALDDLAVKQTGKGHSVDPILRKVSEEDVSPMVREVATEVRRNLQNQRAGWGPGSHRRRLFQAWWWIRQAHRISFNAEIDDIEANRVRNTEFR